MLRKSFRGKNWENITPATEETKPAGIDLDRAIEIFSGEYAEQGWAERSLKYHQENLSVLKKYLVYVRGIEDIGLVTHQVLKDFKGYLVNRGLKKNTVNGRIRTLRVFFGKLADLGYIPTNPAAGLEEIKKRETPVIVPFTDEQVRQLLAQPDQSTFVGLRDWVIMQVLLDTGVRVDELCSLRLGDIDFRHNTITVVRGKGSKTRNVLFGSATRKALLKYISRTGLNDPEGYLFLNQDGGQLKKRTVQDNISNYAQKAGIKGVRCSPHTFRHTFAKMFLMNGGDPYVLRDLMGHSTMNTVIIYLRLFRPDLEQKYRGKSPVDNLFKR
ncbi:tyrosine recombinase XerC [Thermincola ferriacetica]|uniref:Tyrosine recombinase XerC n=1 Tax=Thermincola ferriacetica TaxID=281456 RepID=A0A0L6W2L2_9FIRM|nr:tyrosine-type recombinase/integrase [Thermincola ferriacetica]KNZ69319.1 tyrosine recombinase XerC [Thermincola ferriacetica]